MEFTLMQQFIIIMKKDYKIQYIHENHNDQHEDNAMYYQQ